MIVNRNIIRSIMLKQGMNGADLLRKSGISYITLSRIWKGEEVQIKTVGKLAQALDVSPDYLTQPEVVSDKSEPDRDALLMRFATLAEKQKEFSEKGLDVAAGVVAKELEKIQKQLGE